MKKLLALLLALTMALALCIPAQATGGDETVPALTEEEQAAWEELLRTLQISAYGGVPGQINILLNDHCITFPDAVPEGRNGRTMVPLRAAMESMGALVDYDPVTKSAVVSSEKISFTHVIGTKDIVLSDGSVKTMDVTSYAENGRTMVPLRFFSEVLGYDVQWDNDYRMAYLLDRETMVAALDSQLTVLNEWLGKAEAASALDASRNYRTEIALNGRVKTYGENAVNRSFSVSGSGVSGAAGENAAITGDLSVLSGLLTALSETPVEEAYLALLGAIDLRMIVNNDERCIYLGGSTMTGFLGYEENTWFRYPLVQTTAEQAGSVTIGALLYDTMLATAATNAFQQTYSSVWEQTVSTLSLFADSNFKKSGSSYRLTIDCAVLAACLAKDDPFYTAEDYLLMLHDSGISDLDLRITLKNDGTAKCTGKLAATSEGVAMSMELSAETGKNAATVDFALRIGGMCDLTFTANSTVTASRDQLDLTLPAGAVVVDVSF